MPKAPLRWPFLLVPTWPCSTTGFRAEASVRRERSPVCAREPRCSAFPPTATLARPAKCSAPERGSSLSRVSARTRTSWHRSLRPRALRRTRVIDPPLDERPVLALEDVLDPLLCAVVVRDSSGRLLIANKAYEEILGFRPPEVVRSSNELPSLKVTDVEGKPLRPKDWPAATVLAGRSVSDLTLSLIRPDGRKVWLRVDAARIEKPQFGTLTVSTFIDVTHRQEAEETARIESARATQLLTVLQRLHQQQAGIAELGR